MSEDQQLTVAELLARAQKDNPDAGRRRRRRRSLEEGGVSVAELTGSLKKVQARPPEAKHSSVPIDAPAQPTPANPAEPAQPAQSAKPAGREVEVEKVEVKKLAEAVKPAKFAKPAQAPKQDQALQPEKSTPSADETTVLRKVPNAGVSRPVTSASQGEQNAPEAPKPAAPKPPTQPKATAAPTAPKPAPAAATAAPAAPAPEKPAPSVDETGEIPAVGGEKVGVEKRDARVAEPEVEERGDDAINPILLVVLVFLGLVLGVVGFLAFQWIWANMSTVVAVIAGIAAVLAVIIGVKAMRTGKDALTVTMAAVAAAVMAFGPALI